MKAIWTYIRHNRGFLISATLCSIVLVWVYACQSEVRSIVNPERLVNRDELTAEVESFLSEAELKFKDLDRQDEFKAAIFNAAIDYAQGKTVNPIALFVTLGGILGVGAVIDNQRKDVRIKTMKNNQLNHNRLN